MTRVTLYSRPDCHLCDEMKRVVARVAERMPFTLDEVDISGDAQLERAYGQEIPVLLVNGTKAAKYRVTDWELMRILAARSESG